MKRITFKLFLSTIILLLVASCAPPNNYDPKYRPEDLGIFIEPDYQLTSKSEKTAGVQNIIVSTNFVERINLNPGISTPEFQTFNDTDDDGLSDELEQFLATTYSPLLVFDEKEQEDVAKTLLPLYQVTPITHWSGQQGAMIVFTFLYDNDNGADFDRDWSDWLTDTWNAGCGAAADPFDQLFGKHCGDTEVIYFFIGQWDNWQTTRLTSIYWKRHFDDIYETGDNAVEYDDFGRGGVRTHPVVYVSEDKHGMYPTHEFCEDYQTDVLWDKKNIPCWPKMEDCSGGTSLQITNLPPQWNVGEAKNKDTKNRAALNGTQYQGYDPWENAPFWGRTDNDKLCVDPAGGIGGKWCGSPFASGEGHPCAGPNWWGQAGGAGACMDNDKDRFGSDYFRQEMAGNDPLPCMQLCANDPNCVSFSFVRPGYQGELAVCYLKNSAPVSYDNICCVSGLRSDCLN